MGNRCYNKLEITGNRDSLQSLADYVNSAERVLDFQRVLPYPEDQVSENSTDGGYSETDWRNDHWGTKWNATDSSLKWENNEKAIFEFDTAWAPAIPITIALSMKYPDLVFTHRYDVSRMETRRTATIINGEIVNHIKWERDDYPDTDENV